MSDKEFYKAFLDLVQKTNQDPIKVFGDALTYILWLLSIDQEATPWDYGEEDNMAFADFTTSYFSYVQEEMADRFWIDAWGDMYMELAGKYKSFRGQFFTPAGMSDLAARITASGSRESCGRRVINDCACGSARMLLSAQEQAFRAGDPQPYLIGEDIDGMCCKMAAINLTVHGCIGEVIRHDSLKEPDELIYGYIINETLANGFDYPSIRTSRDRRDFRKFQL